MQDTLQEIVDKLWLENKFDNSVDVVKVIQGEETDNFVIEFIENDDETWIESILKYTLHFYFDYENVKDIVQVSTHMENLRKQDIDSIFDFGYKIYDKIKGEK